MGVVLVLALYRVLAGSPTPSVDRAVNTRGTRIATFGAVGQVADLASSATSHGALTQRPSFRGEKPK